MRVGTAWVRLGPSLPLDALRPSVGEHPEANWVDTSDVVKCAEASMCVSGIKRVLPSVIPDG